MQIFVVESCGLNGSHFGGGQYYVDFVPAEDEDAACMQVSDARLDEAVIDVNTLDRWITMLGDMLHTAEECKMTGKHGWEETLKQLRGE